MKKLLTAFLLTPLFLAAQIKYETSLSDSAFIKMISDNIMVSRSAYDNLYNLTKKVGGRLAGSPQMVMAEAWGKKAMEAAGADKVIMQECMVPHWVRGGKDKASVYYKDASGKKEMYPLSVLALGNSFGSGVKGISADVIRVNNFNELEQKKDQLKGKIVFYNVPFEETFIRTFEAYGKNVIYRANGASCAAKYGASAVLVRSMTNSMDNFAHTGSLHYDDSLPKIPAAAIGLKDVAKIDSLIDNNISVTAQLFTYGKQLPDTIGHNVIAELTGTEFPNEVLTVGGHLDSWDVNEGATDDGAGVVQTIEILRAFKALGFQPKHTIRFVLFANEENGARGGKKYAEDAKANNLKMIFALESDAGGFTPRGFGFTVSDTSWNKIYNWHTLLEPYYGDKFTRGGDGTDIEPLRETLGTAVSGLSPDTQRYFDVHHAPSDVFEFVNIRELKLGAINMAALLYLVDKYGL